MENYGRVYLITNLINGKVYVGQTIREIKKRWYAHVSRAFAPDDHFSILSPAIRKYGKENFSIEALVECPDKESLDFSEEFFIWIYASHLKSFGYNVQLKCRGVGAHGPSTLKLLSEQRKGKKRGPLTEEHRRNISEANKGKKLSEEAKKNISESKTGLVMGPQTPEHIEKRIAPLRGRPSKLKGVPKSPEHRAKIGKAQEGKKKPLCSEELKEKRRQNRLGKTNSPEATQKQIETFKNNYYNDPEAQERRKIAAIKREEAKRFKKKSLQQKLEAEN